MKTRKLTFAQIRELFWNENPQFKGEYNKKYKQKDYNATIRVSFINFIEMLRESNIITESQANRIIL